MNAKSIWINRIFALASLALGIASVFLKDIDKLPIYLLLTYILLRLK